MDKYALIMAGGEGLRAGGEIPKQFRELLGLPILWWSVKAFYHADPYTRISIVMHPGFFDLYDVMLADLPHEVRDIPVRLVTGGRSRGHSVSNGIMALPDSPDALIAVHDAARPLISEEIINRAWLAAKETGSAVPVVPVTDSLRRLETDGDSEPVDRSKYVAVQTPQTFRADWLHAAYRQEERPEFTDDASRVQALGHKITLIEGSPTNLKITTPTDFSIAEQEVRAN